MTVKKTFYLVPHYSHYLPHRVLWEIRMLAGDIIKTISEDRTLKDARKLLREYRRRQ